MSTKSQLSKILLCTLVLGGNFFVSRAQDIAYAKEVVKKLASPGFKGRGYVGGGDQIASAYIAEAFKKSGLVPLNKGSYFQDFKLAVNTFPGKVDVKLNGKTLITAKDYLIGATSPAIRGTFKVIPVKRVDVNTEEKLLSVVQRATDAFILLDDRIESTESTSELGSINASIRALKNSEKLNFKGLIVFTKDKLTWTTLTYQTTRPVITVNKADLDPAVINTLTIDVDARFIPEYTTRNVAGMIKGSSASDSTVVISAHFDHLGMLGNKVYFPGANDNASGVAMLLSFVKYYAKNKPKYNTVFLGFSGEEIGILGSKAFVANPLIDLKKIKFLVNFDLAGTGEEGIKVVNGTVYKKEFDRLVTLNSAFKLVPKVEIRGKACKSDHCRFYEKGVPSFFIYTQGGIAAYHDIYDRSETLPLTEFEHYFELMVKFFGTI